VPAHDEDRVGREVALRIPRLTEKRDLVVVPRES
jgi:hypothetical protein